MKKIKEKIELLKLSFKKEILTILIIDIFLLVIGIISYLFLKQIIFLAFTFFALVLFSYFYLSRYDDLLKKREIEAQDEFVSLLPFLKTFLQNGFSIYQAFGELKNFASEYLSLRLTRLINNIDIDKSIKPYLDFAHEFKSLQIEQLLVCLYQMVDEGNKDIYLVQYELLFNKMRDEASKNLVEKKRNMMDSLSIFPLIASALLIVMITFGVMNIVGESINGI